MAYQQVQPYDALLSGRPSGLESLGYVADARRTSTNAYGGFQPAGHLGSSGGYAAMPSTQAYNNPATFLQRSGAGALGSPGGGYGVQASSAYASQGYDGVGAGMMRGSVGGGYSLEPRTDGGTGTLDVEAVKNVVAKNERLIVKIIQCHVRGGRPVAQTTPDRHRPFLQKKQRSVLWGVTLTD